MYSYKIYHFLKLADVFSIINACFGFSAIFFAFKGIFTYSFVLVILAIFFDSLDGKLARYMKQSSRFGVDLDSLSDVVSFAVAPAFFFYLFSSLHIFIRLIVAFVFLTAGILRLARFDIMKLFERDYPHKKGVYIGLAVPVAAFFASMSVFIIVYYCSGFIANLLLAIVYLFLSYLMVSDIEFKKPRILV
ncbi:CDP-diacylglycerol--serine O-phosphatidyltransferase [Candidatus Micrarchaeota archaeon]|nr:MAG: CDP-diacylglycerol--serine O-phosphatidyltransferase [Candidatus Micrarchaeota archaeon]